MKLFLFAVLLGLVSASWPIDPVCTNIDLQGSTMITPQYEPPANTWPVINAADQLEFKIILPAHYTVVKVWSDSGNGEYVFMAPDPLFGPTGINPTMFDANLNKLECTCPDASGCATPPLYCTCHFRLHLGYLNRFAFSPLTLVGTKWVTNSNIWFDITRTVYLNNEPQEQTNKVVFPIKIEIESGFSIPSGQNLTVYGTSLISGSIIYLEESQYTAQQLKLQFAISAQYPYEVDYVTFDVPTGTDDTIDPPGGVPTLHVSRYNQRLSTISTEKWSFDFFSADSYTHLGHCNQHSNQLRWTGTYGLKVTLKCRPGLSWCEMPLGDQSWWVDQPLSFTVTSNDICLKVLTHDPVNGHTTWYLVAGQTDVQTTEAQDYTPEYNFVADDYVNFVLYGQLTQARSLWFSKLDVKTFKLTQLEPTPVVDYPIYTRDVETSSAATWYHYADISGTHDTATYPYISCDGFIHPVNGHNDAHGGCYSNSAYGYLPSIHLGFKLDAPTFNLIHKTVGWTFKATIEYKLTYDFFTPAKVTRKLFANQATVATAQALFNNAPITPTPALVGPASNAGMIVGIAVGAVAAIALVVAFFVVRQKRKGDAPVKLNDTNQSA